MSPGAEAALEIAWHRASAESSLQRWRDICAQEGWGDIPSDMCMLTRIFGASWYFTRFIFFRGADAARLIDDPVLPGPEVEHFAAALREALGEGGALDARMEQLRVTRNEIMLRILVVWLDGRLSQEAMEQALSFLAEAVIRELEPLAGLGDPACDIATLGMGRLAGREMTFGSDLDLIFLYPGDGTTDPTVVSRNVRAFLRHIAAVTPAGSLYDVDMRLRPHGTSGSLITSAASFHEYHTGDRATWERQVMTRCRPISDPHGLAAQTLEGIMSGIYGYFEPGDLRRDIRDMRMRVERELGRPRGRREIKRGRGGIMDVDFITHYLQLGFGREDPALRSCSTRRVLRTAGERGLLGAGSVATLLDSYDYLRRAETCLRLFDVKSVSAFAEEGEALIALARAMGHEGDDPETFLAEYAGVTDNIRREFEALLEVEP